MSDKPQAEELIEFLTKYLQRDEHWLLGNTPVGQYDRAVADIEAKQFILAEAERALKLASYMNNVPLIFFYQRIMIKMSQVYKDKPDFKEEWLR